jgi:hypothetical protein
LFSRFDSSGFFFWRFVKYTVMKKWKMRMSCMTKLHGVLQMKYLPILGGKWNIICMHVMLLIMTILTITEHIKI